MTVRALTAQHGQGDSHASIARFSPMTVTRQRREKTYHKTENGHVNRSGHTENANINSETV